MKAIVTAGPTYEEIDPVRFIGNYSSGKMGFALAHSLAVRGIHVTLVTGPTHLQTRHPLVTRIDVVSAEEMFNACMSHFADSQIVVLAAAVADYKPVRRAPEKIKKGPGNLTLELEKTIDIALTLGKLKTEEQILAGFALESENEKVNAIKKLIAKNLDLIVLNSLRDTGAGFRHDTNKVTVIHGDGTIRPFELRRKEQVAEDITNEVIAQLTLKQNPGRQVFQQKIA
jgi:phosphopantothenoylcysteine decarboxylase / phosphopantothenate---cysteine ligase